MNVFHCARRALLRSAFFILLALGSHLRAQPTIAFNNRVVSVTPPIMIVAPIYGPEPDDPSLRLRGNATTNGGTVEYHGPLLKGNGYYAALYVGPAGTVNENQLQLVGTPTTFRTTDSLAGFIVPVNVTAPLPAGSFLTCQVRAWDNRNGTVNSWDEALDALAPRGSSGLFSPPTPVGAQQIYLVGLTSFCIASPLPAVPQITTQPATTNVPAGGTATFRVGYLGARPLSFQWRYFGTNLPTETNDALVRANVSYLDAGPFSVVLSNRYNMATSQAAMLNIRPALLPPERTTPSTVRLRYDSTPGRGIALEMRPEVPGVDWTTLATATNATVRAELFDTNAITSTRFYRMRLVP